MTQLKNIGFQDEIPLDNEVVHNTGNETVAGEKTFTSPFSLETETTGDTEITLEKADSTNWWSKTRLAFIRYRGTLTSKLATQVGDVIGVISFSGYNGSILKTLLNIEVKDNGARGQVLINNGDIQVDGTLTATNLSNLDNTSDLNKPISTATQSALDSKVDKIVGKGLSQEDYTTVEKSKLAGIESGAEVNNISDFNATDLTDGGDTTLHTHDSRYYTESETDTLLLAKANDIEVVKLTGDQTVSGIKIFNNSSVHNGFIILRNNSDAVMFFQKDDGTSRWALFKNSLQDFVLNRYNDSGVFQDNPIYIDGATGYTKLQTGLYNYKKLALGASKDLNGASQVLGEIEVGYSGGNWIDGYIGINAPSTTPYSTLPSRALTILSDKTVIAEAGIKGVNLTLRAGGFDRMNWNNYDAGVGARRAYMSVYDQAGNWVGNPIECDNFANGEGTREVRISESRIKLAGRVKIMALNGDWTAGSQRLNWGGDGTGWRFDFGSINNANTENSRAISFYDNGYIETIGGIIVGNASWATAGMIRWNGTKFQGYTGSAWVDFH